MRGAAQTHENTHMANQLEPAEVSVACDSHDAILYVSTELDLCSLTEAPACGDLKTAYVVWYAIDPSAALA